MTDPAALTRAIAELLGYTAVERRPRGSLHRYFEVISPEGGLFGSASGREDEPALIDAAWRDALDRLPPWPHDLTTAAALLEGHRWALICDAAQVRCVIALPDQPLLDAMLGGAGAWADTPALAICLAWLRIQSADLTD